MVEGTSESRIATYAHDDAVFGAAHPRRAGHQPGDTPPQLPKTVRIKESRSGPRDRPAPSLKPASLIQSARVPSRSSLLTSGPSSLPSPSTCPTAHTLSPRVKFRSGSSAGCRFLRQPGQSCFGEKRGWISCSRSESSPKGERPTTSQKSPRASRTTSQERDEAQDRRVGARAPACPVSKATPRPRH